MSEYAAASRSKLKLKGVDPGSINISKKKKKKKKSKSKDQEKEVKHQDQHREEEEEEGEEDPEQQQGRYYQAKTKSEIAFLKRKEELVRFHFNPFVRRNQCLIAKFCANTCFPFCLQDAKRIREKAKSSHKERVQKFNDYLNNLSEHYEQAKVSWTK